MELGEERIKEIKEAYDLYDPLNKGVGLTQIYNILQCLGIDININELNELVLEFGEVSSKEDNNPKVKAFDNKIPEVNLRKVSYNNLLLLLSKKLKESDLEEDIIDCFKMIDVNGNGCIGYEEIKYLMLLLGENFCDEEIYEIINQVDTNGKGHITYEDFVKMTLIRD